MIQNFERPFQLHLRSLQVGKSVQVAFGNLRDLRSHLHQLPLDDEVLVDGGAADREPALYGDVAGNVLLSA